MHILLFFLAGITFAVLGFLILKSSKQVDRNSIRIMGRIIAIKNLDRTVRNIFGTVESVHPIKAPEVEYEYHGRFKFVESIQSDVYGLKVGDSIAVLIDPENPSDAKLQIGHNHTQSQAFVFIGLGLCAMVYAGISFDFEQFDINSLTSPIAIVTIACLGFVIFKLSPIIRQLLALSKK